MQTPRWLGAVEGYYGPPLRHRDRLELVAWLASQGYNAYAYAPKHDPYHRDRWRDAYPPAAMREFEELRARADAAGIALVMVISPGLDWRHGDEAALVQKLRGFTGIGIQNLGIAFDDVPPGGAELGAAHAAAVTVAVSALGRGPRWVTCPVDYSADHVTSYLGAFVPALPEGVDIMWTGPSIVSPTVSGGLAGRLGRELGRPLLFAENYPVNDGTMAGVLHLGPYPRRDPGLVAATTGVFVNMMARPLASRVGLAVAGRFWTDPDGDRDQAWADSLAAVPGITALARGSRSWVGDAGPDPDLVGDVDEGRLDAVLAFLRAGCRGGLSSELASEVEMWLEQWEYEAAAMEAAIGMIQAPPEARAELAQLVALLWARARSGVPQLFGIRWSYYPVTARDGDQLIPAPEALVEGENLTDRLCRLALGAG